MLFRGGVGGGGGAVLFVCGHASLIVRGVLVSLWLSRVCIACLVHACLPAWLTLGVGWVGGGVGVGGVGGVCDKL